MLAALRPVLEGVTAVWLSGTNEAVRLANAILAEATLLAGIPVGAGAGRLRALMGVRSSSIELARRREHVQRLGDLRRELAALARQETGLDTVDFKSGGERLGADPDGTG
jgi:hypothetical protein